MRPIVKLEKEDVLLVNIALKKATEHPKNVKLVLANAQMVDATIKTKA